MPLCCLVGQSCLTLSDSMDWSTPGFPVLHHLQSLLKLRSTESVMPSNHLILCRPLLLMPSIFPSTRVLAQFAVSYYYAQQPPNSPRNQKESSTELSLRRYQKSEGWVSRVGETPGICGVSPSASFRIPGKASLPLCMIPRNQSDRWSDVVWCLLRPSGRWLPCFPYCTFRPWRNVSPS